MKLRSTIALALACATLAIAPAAWADKAQAIDESTLATADAARAIPVIESTPLKALPVPEAEQEEDIPLKAIPVE